jgi:hypothetical protein
VKHRRPVLVIAVLTAGVIVAACSSGNSTASKSAAHSTTSSSAAQTAGSGSSPQAAASPSTSAHTSGMCSSIDQQTAETILGFTTAAGSSAKAGTGSSVMKKIDGCFYNGGANGSLGYDVTQVNAQIGQAMISAAKSKMAGAQVTAFDAGLPNSIAFTQHLPLGVDSQVTVLAGDRFVSVAATRKDGNVAKAQASATAAAKTLVAHT